MTHQARIALELRLHKAKEALLDYANERKAARQAHLGVAVTTQIYEAITDAIAALSDPPLSGAETPSLCASCSDTAEGYAHLAAAFLVAEQPLGLTDGLGSFAPRLTRLVAELQRPIADYDELAHDAARHGPSGAIGATFGCVMHEPHHLLAQAETWQPRTMEQRRIDTERYVDDCLSIMNVTLSPTAREAKIQQILDVLPPLPPPPQASRAVEGDETP